MTQIGMTSRVVDVLYGETLSDLKGTYPRKGSGRWFTLPGWIFLLPEKHQDPRMRFGNRVSAMLWQLNGAGYYDIMQFGGHKHIERHTIIWVQGKQGNTVYWQYILD